MKNLFGISFMSAGIALITGALVLSACNVNKHIPVENILLDMTSMSMNRGEVLTLGVTIYPETASVEGLEWTSSDESIALVDKNGTITATNVGSVTITVSSEGITATCDVTVVQPPYGISLNLTECSLDLGESISLEATVEPDNATDKRVSWASNNPSVAIVSEEGTVTAVGGGTALIVATTQVGGVARGCTVIVQSIGIENDHIWVDLDLPSGIKWARTNVGALSQLDHGDFFAWGETEPKDYYHWSTLKYYETDEYGGHFTKYNKVVWENPKNKDVLEPMDDAATVNWGGGWRTPTKIEMEELKNECNWLWTSIEGTLGFKITSKNNSSYIFLPVTGAWSYKTYDDRGLTGYYWCSTMDDYPADLASALNIYAFTASFGSCPRWYGFAVRPVCD